MKFGKKTIAIIAAIVLVLSYVVYEYVTGG